MRLLFSIFLLLCAATSPLLAQSEVERGEYLATLGDCGGCHTAAHKPAFSGGLPFTAPFGTVYSTNITPDLRTGIGGWNADQFYRALHEGIAADGHHLYPAFPYVYFKHISKADSDALFAYLKSLKPVDRPPTPNRLLFPLNIRGIMIFWNWLYLDKRQFVPTPTMSQAWNRGAYIVNGLGHCAACHTPKDILFGDETSKALTGTTLEHWYAANLTGNGRDGLGKWTRSDLIRYFATGRNRYATAAGSMQEKVTLSLSKITDADRDAIAIYLKSLPFYRSQTLASSAADQMQRGQTLFVNHCSLCHGPTGSPNQVRQLGQELPDYPALGGDTLVLGRDPTTVVRIVLEGAQSPVTAHEPTTFSMPSFATLNDSEIADVTTYLRNSWGNRAPSVKASDVAILRRALAREPQVATLAR
jgi:mono/diheme cytochrome c family protein